MATDARMIAVFADTKGRAPCRGCGASITWAEVVKSGKRMCFTGAPVALRTEHTEDRRLVEYLPFEDNHWAMCPNAPQFKTKGPR